MTKLLPLASLTFILSGCSLVSEIPQNFEDCVKTGAPIMESYPRQCGWSGQIFIEEISETPIEAPIEEPVQIANPASVNCEAKDGTLEIREDAEENQNGFCVFEDGSECEEWAFFRDECQPEITPEETSEVEETPTPENPESDPTPEIEAPVETPTEDPIY